MGIEDELVGTTWGHEATRSAERRERLTKALRARQEKPGPAKCPSDRSRSSCAAERPGLARILPHPREAAKCGS